ncbi:MAG: outer membrane protein transport protein [Deltaproteobacteria bacterium]|nr:outer membrane protein transport protein [Deltaproteobacteria bacterium]
MTIGYVGLGPERSNSRLFRLAALSLLLPALIGLGLADALAQVHPSMQIASSPNPVGSGARALGMGGAFIAVADDATAASWNPGGLIQLETPELSVVGAYGSSKDQNTSHFHPEANGEGTFSSFDVNYFSAAYPFHFLDRNMVVSLNVQHLYDFNKDIKYNFTTQGQQSGIPYRNDTSFSYESRGDLRTVSPAFSLEITPGLSLGATVNVWTDKLFWKNEWSRKLSYTSKDSTGKELIGLLDEKYHDIFGINYHVGALWNINKTVTLGAVLKTPFTMKLTRDTYQDVHPPNPPIPPIPSNTREDMELRFPISYGLGVAVRYSDHLTLSADIYRTEWSQYILKDSHGNETSPVADLPASQADVPATHQVRLGGEYLFILDKTIIPARAGLFYDPQPTQGGVNNFYGFSLGTGCMIGDMVLDVAYQFRWSLDSKGILLQVPDATTDETQHTFLMSVIYHF